MTGAGVGRDGLSDGDPTADVAPVVGADGFWAKAGRFDGVDGLKPRVNFHPGLEVEENFSARADEGDTVAGLVSGDGAEDPQAGERRAVVAGFPVDEGEDRARGEADGSAAAVELVVSGGTAEADPALKAGFQPD